jgi:hypothetical protein
VIPRDLSLKFRETLLECSRLEALFNQGQNLGQPVAVRGFIFAVLSAPVNASKFNCKGLSV